MIGKMTKELRLIAHDIMSGNEIDGAMKKVALEQITVLMMNHEEGEAELVILKRLEQAIENESKEAMLSIGDDIEAAFPEIGKQAHDETYDKATITLATMAADAIDDFMESGPGSEDARGKAVSFLAGDIDAMPLAWENGIIIAYNPRADIMFCCIVNDHVPRQRAIDRFEALAKGSRVFDAIKQYTGNNTSKVAFFWLDINEEGEPGFEQIMD